MYDFKELDYKEFELLTRDLLQKELGLRFETFSPGKDQGIDCLYSIDNNYHIVVQCKHFAGSNFEKLFNKLKKEELKKVKKIQPQRYILVTSLSLTLNNKQKIIDLFGGFIKNTSDVIDNNSLNNLLNDYPEIIKNYLKLWIKDSDYIEYLLNRQTHNKSKYKLKDIKHCLNIFVQTPSFADALKKMDDYNYVIITGSQGVGKTTLANMLSWKYINEDHEFFYITNVKEGWELLKENKKQIFYYDDFLGSTQLETLNRSEDTDLINFINVIKNEKDKKFVLTSRDYILKDAEKKSEKFYHTNFVIQKVQDTDFSDEIKKEIYKKHLTESTLPDDYKTELLKEKNVKSIALHKNYNPRIIEYITNTDNLKAHGVCCVNCCKQLSAFLLDNPTKLWEHPFKEVLDNTGRAFLFTLHTFGGKYEKSPELFEKAVSSALSVLFGETLSGKTFNDTLHLLDGFFININEDYSLSFKNPSIIDYLDHECDEHNLWGKIIDFSIYNDQLDWLYYERINYEEENEWLEKLIIKFTTPEFFKSLSEYDFRENLLKIISVPNKIKSNIYDKHIINLLSYVKSTNLLDIDDILELIEFVESHNMPTDSVVLNFFIEFCYPIFEKLKNDEEITREECEMICAVIVRYINQIDSSQDAKIKQEIFISMDNLIKHAQDFIQTDNPNNLQSIYADNLIDYISLLPE